ncbi:MAG: DUF5906 domain-containing protein [Burkholderiales bacterium]|nr:DUF5906 domain-containing protein [Burkholderiales bacterium]
MLSTVEKLKRDVDALPVYRSSKEVETFFRRYNAPAGHVLSWRERMHKKNAPNVRPEETISKPAATASDDFPQCRARAWTLPEMLTECVFLQDGAQVTTLSKPDIALSFQNFRTMTAASFERTDAGKKILIADQWAAHPERLEVFGRTHAPGRPAIAADPLGRICVNFWRDIPHTVPRDWEGRCKLFVDHIAFLIPAPFERELFMDWLAHIEQKPGERPHFHFLMRTDGAQGIGRNYLAEVMARMWPGRVSLSVDLMRILDGGFNGLVAGSLVAVVDEIHADQAHASPRRVAQALKSELTASVRNVRPKYGREYTEFCATRWLMFSNHVRALPLPKEDRRLVVIKNPEVAKDSDYYRTIYAALNDGEFIASVREFLRQRDLSDFNPGLHAPLNDAKSAMILATTSAADLAAAEVIQQWPADLITSGELANELADEDGKRPTGSMLRAIAIEAGMVPGRGQIKLGGNPVRYWILRNSQIWQSANHMQMRTELKKVTGR